MIRIWTYVYNFDAQWYNRVLFLFLLFLETVNASMRDKPKLTTFTLDQASINSG